MADDRPQAATLEPRLELDPFAARFLDMLASTSQFAPQDRSLDAYRRGYDRLCAFAASPYETACETLDRELKLPGRALPIRAYAPRGACAADVGTLIWFHGGGWIAGGLESSDLVCRLLAHALGSRVISVAYRLAPEHRLPAAFEDGCEALRALAEQESCEAGARGRLSIGGDSAGAQIAVAASLHARDAGVPLERQILLSPVLDPFGDWPSRTCFGRGFLLEKQALADYAGFWGAALDRDDPRLSPLRAADLRGLPPAHIHAATHDPVRDEARAYAQALRRAGVPVRYCEHAGIIHNFFTLGKVIPSARAALAKIVEDVKSPPLADPS